MFFYIDIDIFLIVVDVCLDNCLSKDNVQFVALYGRQPTAVLFARSQLLRAIIGFFVLDCLLVMLIIL